jgi:hypothetical protein
VLSVLISGNFFSSPAILASSPRLSVSAVSGFGFPMMRDIGDHGDSHFP